MAINFDTALGINADALKVRTQRAELLATNLANADTPNFKAQDIDFRSALNSAMTGGGAEGLKTTNAHHFTTNAESNGLMAPLQYLSMRKLSKHSLCKMLSSTKQVYNSWAVSLAQSPKHLEGSSRHVTI
ncbi:hypothetical protein LCGC14_1627320 [marine sediment metagenome]|uniref:Flagellar basal body rod protein N-terminal domain-containing protein n=1 Tax=marine sediment metagenome TaxID=412755 RepID=A0A0F9IQQ0_9ZZZZ